MLSEGTERVREEEPSVVGSCTPPTKGFKPASRFWIFAILLLVAVGSSWYVWYTWDQNGVPSFAVREDNGGKNSGTVNETARATAAGESALPQPARTDAGETSMKPVPAAGNLCQRISGRSPCRYDTASYCSRARWGQCSSDASGSSGEKKG